MADSEIPCALCGEPILDNPTDPEEAMSDEHVPPLQFFPKALRVEIRDQLWKVPSHRRCNQAEKLDEEYFLHYMYPLVGYRSEAMGQPMLDELKRRAQKPQSRGLIRRILKEQTDTSPGGIILPPSLVRINFDLKRIQNVVVKVTKCLFYKEYGRYLPRSSCVHMEQCEEPKDLQPVFLLLCSAQDFEKQSAAPEVFRYWHRDVDGEHYYALLFWDAVMFCTIFQDPAKRDEPTVVQAS